MAEVRAEEGWHEHVVVEATKVLEHIATDILADAVAICPVDTGNLVKSLDKEIDPNGSGSLPSARIGSTDVKYSIFVEEGHRIVAWGHDTGRFQPPQPYLRPALFRERSV